MKLIDTVTSYEDVQKNGVIIGLKSALPELANDCDNMNVEYYLNHSGEKTFSRLAENIARLSNTDMLSLSEQQKFGYKYIAPKFSEKWSRIYNALVASQYNPLVDYEHTETKTGTENRTDTYDTAIKKTGTNTDNTEYNLTDKHTANNTDNLEKSDTVTRTGTNADTVTYDTDTTTTDKRTTTGGNEYSDDRYGFNSNSPVGVSVSSGSDSETESEDKTEAKTGTEKTDKTINEKDVQSGTDNRTITESESDTKTGTENNSKSINENEAKTGTDKSANTSEFTTTVSGRNTSGADLVKKELDVYNKSVFWDIVFKDVDSVLTIPIYI